MKRSIAVLPSRSQVTPYCTELTGWTQESLAEKGVPLHHAFTQLVIYGGRKAPWASWGVYDRKMIENSAKEFGYESPVSSKHINVKTLYALCVGRATECNMETALQELNMPLEGKHHSGVDDAYNIAKILVHLLGKMRQ
jgi:inhibitor of KinA sporulation pathway (predicted exonuclease)